MIGPRRPQAIAGVCVVVLGLFVRFLAFLALPSTLHIEGLVTSGIYARSDKPFSLPRLSRERRSAPPP
jgi:hypothetical protein